MTKPILVLPEDLVAAGMCLAGAREWAAAHDMDFRQFITVGTPIDQMRAVNCPLGNRVCDAAEKRVAKGAA